MTSTILQIRRSRAPSFRIEIDYTRVPRRRWHLSSQSVANWDRDEILLPAYIVKRLYLIVVSLCIRFTWIRKVTIGDEVKEQWCVKGYKKWKNVTSYWRMKAKLLKSNRQRIDLHHFCNFKCSYVRIVHVLCVKHICRSFNIKTLLLISIMTYQSILERSIFTIKFKSIITDIVKIIKCLHFYLMKLKLECRKEASFLPSSS